MRKRLFAVFLSAAVTAALGAAAFAQQIGLPGPTARKVAVSGKVVDNTGKIIPGAKVFVTYSGADGKPGVLTTYADKQGRFKGEVVALQWMVTGVADHYNYSYGERSPNGGEFEIKLWPEYKITGKVIDEDGQPLEGVTVTSDNCQGYNYSSGAVERTGFYNSPEFMKCTTGKDGSFTIRHLPNPESFEQFYINVVATKKGCARIVQSVSQRDLGALSLMTMPKECVLEGTLKLPENVGDLAAGSYLALVVDGKWGADYRAETPSKDGRFRMAELPPGKHTLALQIQNYQRGPNGQPLPTKADPYVMPAQQIDLQPGQVKSIEAKAVRGALIKGVVTDKSTGKPFSSVTLSVIHEGAVERYGGTVAVPDAEGNFEVRVTPGPVKLVVQKVDNRYQDPTTAPSLELTVSEGEEKTGVEFQADLAAGQAAYNTLGNAMPDDFELTPGTYDLTWDPELVCNELVRSSCVKWDYVASFAYKKKPQLVSANPRYWIYRVDSLKDGMLGFILDESRGTGTGYDTVYIDANRDWDLTNDAPVKIGKIGNYEYGYTDWVKVQSSRQPGYTTLRIGAMWSGLKNDELYGHVWQQGAWKGSIQTNKGAAECALIDFNTNGVFGDPIQRLASLQIKDKGDCLVVDTNGAGKLRFEGYGPQFIGLDPVCRVGQKYYTIKADPSGNKLTIEPYAGPMAKLNVSAKDVCGMDGRVGTCEVAGKQGAYTFSRIVDGSIELPAGDYQLASAGVTLTSGGKNLSIRCAASSPVHIQPGQESRVEISGKATVKIDAPQVPWKPGSTVPIQWQMKIGEVASVASIGDGSPAFAPKVKFLDKAGKLVHTTTAGYT